MTGAGEFRSRPWRRPCLHDLPVRGKLFAALAVPMAAFLAVAILAGVTWLPDAASYGHGVTAAKLGRDVTAAVHEMQLERDLAAGFIMSGRGANPTSRALADRLNTEQRVVDKALTRFQASLRSSSGRLGRGASPLSAQVRQSMAALPALRQAVRGGKLPIGAILSEYSTTISRLLAFDRRIGQDRNDDELRYSTMVLNDLSTIKEINSQIRGQLYATALTGRFEFGAAERMSGLLAEEQTAEDAFRAAARPSDRIRYDQIVNGQALLTVKRTPDRAVQRQRLPDLGIDPDQWFAASTTHIELLRTVETGLLDNVIGSASELRSTAWERTAILGALIITIMVGAIVWTLAIARTMTGPLRRLRTGALDVAHERLPHLIEQLQTAYPDQVDTTIRSIAIAIDSRDEIGEVARTFDELQHEAVRLAAEQAGLRRNVNTLFLSLSRRSQSLIERQIALIDRLEATEENPLQLENLFKLDHLATRMRRNSENLLVLAGAGPGRRRAGPVPLGDVLQAAIGEIEQYERIQIIEVPEVQVAADSVNHVVHLVAELLENAAQFSPPYLAVDLAASRLDDGRLLIIIDDAGLGMSEKELTAANQRLAEPPVFDFSIAQRLGLFVVARLAARHDIAVRLARSDTGGVRALVHLPAVLLVASIPPRGTAPRGNGLAAPGLAAPGATGLNGHGPTGPTGS
ncbi:sensor histidine kinase, partial [Frankia sp. CcWB3]